MEPVLIRRILPVFQHVLERAEIQATVIEYAVEHNADAVLMGLVHQLLEGLLVPEVGVNLRVIHRIVLMVGAGQKNRAQIQGIHTQLLQIIQLFDQPAQVTAVLAGNLGQFAPGGLVLRIQRGIAVAEAVQEDLVEHGALHPRGAAVHIV